MQIAGIQKLTLVDFPGRVAATVFTRGCSFRCPFCHNPELVLPEQFSPLLSENEVFDFLESRYGKLTGVCITGGEPLVQKDIRKFISLVKAIGFDVKLDTNGSFPDKLEQIIRDGEIDYIAMDIKGPLSKYAEITNIQQPTAIQHPTTNKQLNIENCPSRLDLAETDKLSENWKLKIGKLQSDIKRSIRLIMSSGIDYEFRTTVCQPLHEVADFQEIGEMIRGAKRYFIQQFVKSKQIDDKIHFKPFTESESKEVKNIMTHFVKSVELR